MSSRGDLIFLDLVEDLISLKEEVVSAMALFWWVISVGCTLGETRDWILGIVVEYSLVTWSIMLWVWENLSNHLTNHQRVRTSPSLAYCHFNIQGTLYFLTKWSKAGNLAPWESVLKILVKYLKEPINGPRNISGIGPNWVHQLQNQSGKTALKFLSKLTNQEWVMVSFWWSINLN